ncbi:hypothetical protein [Pseudoroseomonas ludipueritiae]|uniref:Uncharacterized protein n=1 Tax=Pseudoroseomonas ludipueritiae TaxID=198093 RepID=A0ABR7R5P7_9PROT|nr:hypothetical protein [Pseudoroseomonas ludipueritiae]MBC9177055.1 hypothetical protein [Pseudoroseomonas ludipueritiae]
MPDGRGAAIERFFDAKRRGLASRARRLVGLTRQSVGLRQEDLPFAPSQAHFAAANQRLWAIDRAVRMRLTALARLPRGASLEDRLLAMAMVEREVDRSRRAFGLFFEVFAQRGTAFARPLAAHDAIARDCYAAVTAAAPRIFPGTLLPPLTYLEHGYSPATIRRGVTLSRLLGETNPFPLIRIPFDRDRPWQAVFLHEVAHNLQADLGLWVEVQNAVLLRLSEMAMPPRVTSVFGRWQKEIFADLAALLLGGPAAAWGMAEFLSHPADKVMTYRPGGAHPTGYLRVPIMAEMLRRMGFGQDAAELLGVWTGLYNPRRGHRIPRAMLASAREAIPAVVDEIAFQPRRALAERVLASVIPFTSRDQAAIRRGGLLLARGRMPGDLPPRFLVSACHYALAAGVAPHELGRMMLERLVPVGHGAGTARPAPAQIEPKVA